MRTVWLLIALWNTLVMAINLTVLPHFGLAAMTYINWRTQLLPIAIPLLFYALSFDKVRWMVWR